MWPRSRRSFTAKAVALAALGVAAFAACQSEPQYPPTAEGLYLAHCARCHEVDGSSATSSDLAGYLVDLREPVFQNNVPDAEIAHIIEFGQGKMQGIAGLHPAEVESLVLHVRHLGRAAVEAGAQP